MNVEEVDRQRLGKAQEHGGLPRLAPRITKELFGNNRDNVARGEKIDFASAVGD